MRLRSRKKGTVHLGSGAGPFVRIGPPCRLVIVRDDGLICPHRLCRHNIRHGHIRLVTTRFGRCITGRPGIDFHGNRFVMASKRRAVRKHVLHGNNGSLPVLYGICANVAIRRRTLLFTRRGNFSTPLATNVGLHTGIMNNSTVSGTFLTTAGQIKLDLGCSDRRLASCHVNYINATFQLCGRVNRPLCYRAVQLVITT